MTLQAALLLPLVWGGPAMAVALVLRAANRASLRWRWLLAGIALFTAYAVAAWLALPVAYDVLPAEGRWPGRLAGLIVGLAALALLLARARRCGVSWSAACRDMGLTLRQAPGSLRPALAGVAILIALAIIPGGVVWAGLPSADAIFYHLTLPGLEEELIYRALLPALFMAGLGGALPGEGAGREREQARLMPWALAMGVLVMAFGHAVTLSDASLLPDPIIVIHIGLIGAVLADIRWRTGSILIPVIAHNLLGLAARVA
jgi:hypothetical protein